MCNCARALLQFSEHMRIGSMKRTHLPPLRTRGLRSAKSLSETVQPVWPWEAVACRAAVTSNGNALVMHSLTSDYGAGSTDACERIMDVADLDFIDRGQTGNPDAAVINDANYAPILFGVLGDLHASTPRTQNDTQSENRQFARRHNFAVTL